MAVVNPNSVLPDANIWVSETLHSWFGLLASMSLGSWSFRWTEDIFNEAGYHRRRRFIDKYGTHVDSSRVESLRDRLETSMGKEARISGFAHDDSVNVIDPYDAHVHDAAVHAGIGVVVTDNIKDFTKIYDDPDDCPYDVMTADEFLTLAAESAPEMIDTVILCQYRYWAGKRKPFNLPAKLRAAGCQEFSRYVAGRLQVIALPG
ncbi:PIN domain-containing protein [Corynebacterium glyciniphilum]|uniref:PIN domain-containing protein n=1 Tax=Corynebacterium glyciniphilum TaxID=1404244 RepID=UPI0011AB54A5|nr:PIN domain-containing protein [Corynebacterium glyciniphilum]